MRKLVFLLASITTVYAGCVEFANRQAAFCAYDYVSHVKVLSKSRNPKYTETLVFNYNVQHIETFRKRLSVTKLPEVLVTFSPSVSGFNGVDLEVGKEYVLSGTVNKIEEDLPEILTECPKMYRLLTEWDQLVEEEKQALWSYTCPEST